MGLWDEHHSKACARRRLRKSIVIKQSCLGRRPSQLTSNLKYIGGCKEALAGGQLFNLMLL